MAQGSLLLPPGYTPLYQGAPVTSGKFGFYRTATTTEQDTYSDSTLLVANDNPLALDANGSLIGLVYGNPASGFDYRIRLLDSADAVLWTLDDVVVDGADTTTFTEATFTATLTGYAAGPT